MKSMVVTDYGVVADKEELQTGAVQAVIDKCRDIGGGEIIFPAGTYRIGSIRLYSHMTIHLMAGAKLEGSKNYKDYEDFHVPTTMGYVTDEHYIKIWNLPPYYIYGMICAFEAEDVSIIGDEGAVIDGQDCFDPNGEEHFRGPMGMILCKCSKVRLEGYTFINSANWSHQIDSCHDVNIHQVTVKAGHDGFNVHHCRNVKIEDCHLETGDDCFAGYDVQDLTVKNCYANTACNGMRIGGQRLLFENCVFEGPGHYPHRSENTYYTHAVFKYYGVRPDKIDGDGENIVFKNCRISKALRLLSYDYQKEGMHQDNRPLRSLLFEDTKISFMDDVSFFKGNGEKCKLTFKHVDLELEETDHPFMEIDDSIVLSLQHVSCNRKCKILAGKDTEILLDHAPQVDVVRAEIL